MRLIPGKVKVKLELFKGVSFEDIIVGAVFLLLAILVFISNLPGRIIIAAILIIIGAFLELRIDEEPNYKLFLNIFKKMSMPSFYKREYTDEDLLKKAGVVKEKNEEGTEEPEEKPLSHEELKELIRKEDKILKSKTATEEEKDAVWLARAKRSAEKKRKQAEKRTKETDNVVNNMIPYTGIKDGFIEYGGEYYGAVFEITPVDFRFFSKYRRNNSIENCVGKILRSLSEDYGMNLVKVDRPVNYDAYLDKEREKLGDLKRSYENGMLSENELKSRAEIEFSRIYELEDMNTEDKVINSFYYLVLFEKDKRNVCHFKGQR